MAGGCSVSTDQRDLQRGDGACDAGAYELQCLITMDDSIRLSADSNTFDVVTGVLSELHADGDFSRASCMGTFATSPIADPHPDPIAGEGRYYLAACGGGYGVSSTGDPDPRDALVFGPCP